MLELMVLCVTSRRGLARSARWGQLLPFSAPFDAVMRARGGGDATVNDVLLTPVARPAP